VPCRFSSKIRNRWGRGGRRVCRERIGKARTRLRNSDRPAAVHGVCKEIKKLRALFRLVRGEIGKDVYRNGTKALREAANRLAAHRDARVMLKVFAKLAGRRAKPFDGIEAALKNICAGKHGGFERMIQLRGRSGCYEKPAIA